MKNIFVFLILVLWGETIYARTEKYVFTVLYNTAVSDTLNIPISDLKSYITNTIPFSKVILSDTDSKEKPVGNVIVIVDRDDTAIGQLCRQYGVGAPPTEWNSFCITSFVRKDDASCNIYFWRGLIVGEGNMRFMILQNVFLV